MKALGRRRIARRIALVGAALLTASCVLAPGTAGSAPRWRAAAPLGAARADHAALVAPDGVLYVLGGWDYLSAGVAHAVETDEASSGPVDTAWTAIANPPSARFALSAAAAGDGRIFVFGGLDDFFDLVDTIDVYDPVSNAWVTRPSPFAPGQVCGQLTTGADGRIYVLGPGAGAATYDPPSNSAIAVPSMLVARGCPAAVTAPDGRIVALGGDADRTVEAYNPARRRWTMLAPLPRALGSSVAAAVGGDERIYATNGSRVAAYDFVTDRWLAAPALPRPHFGVSLTSLNGTLFAIGGGVWHDCDGDGCDAWEDAVSEVDALTPVPQTDACTIHGSEAADTITGTAGADVICGGAGDDTIDPGGGNDVVVGGGGRDTVLASAGRDRIEGDTGDDVLYGGAGDDAIDGGDGGDVLDGGGGQDTLAAQDHVNGNDRAFGGAGVDRCAADPGDVVIACEP